MCRPQLFLSPNSIMDTPDVLSITILSDTAESSTLNIINTEAWFGGQHLMGNPTLKHVLAPKQPKAITVRIVTREMTLSDAQQHAFLQSTLSDLYTYYDSATITIYV